MFSMANKYLLENNKILQLQNSSVDDVKTANLNGC